MSGKLKHSTMVKYISMFIALLLLNCSVDSPDFYKKHIPENLCINDQESIIELVVEKVFGYDNAIPEYDDADSSEANNSIALDLFIVPPTFFTITPFTTYNCNKEIFSTNQQLLTACLEIHSPPPLI